MSSYDLTLIYYDSEFFPSDVEALPFSIRMIEEYKTLEINLVPVHNNQFNICLQHQKNIGGSDVAFH